MAALLTTASTLMCPHGGAVSIVSSNTRVQAGGTALVRASDTFLISGCALSSLTPPQPCITVNWVQPDARSQVLGDFTLNEASVGLCVAANQAVQGTVLVVVTQAQVSGL